ADATYSTRGNNMSIVQQQNLNGIDGGLINQVLKLGTNTVQKVMTLDDILGCQLNIGLDYSQTWEWKEGMKLEDDREVIISALPPERQEAARAKYAAITARSRR
ncbi:hypothetical protein OAW27_00830, partial [bacterium]|nr:hypothetical protein [bacterium]